MSTKARLERLVIYAPVGTIKKLERGRRKTAFPSMSSYALSLLLRSLEEEGLIKIPKGLWRRS